MDVRRWLPFLAAGLVAGVLSGLFGVGGGLVIVPILVFFFHFKQKNAQATSLCAIVLTAISGAIPYSLVENIDWIAAGLIVVGGVTGSTVGASIAKRVKDQWLQVIFAAVAIASALKMIFDAPADDGASVFPSISALAVVAYIGAGLAMGLLSSLVGVGGGIILVPLLSLLIGLSQTNAQGLSLIVMAPISLVGALRHSRSGYTNWAAGVAIGIGGAIMSPITAQVALNMPSTILPKLFALLLIYTAGQLIHKAVKSWRAPEPAPSVPAEPSPAAPSPAESSPAESSPADPSSPTEPSSPAQSPAEN